MSLDSALTIATNALANINAGIGVVSQNVANASTPGYAAEVSTQTDLTANGVEMGVRTGPTTLDIDQQLQADVLSQNASVSGLQTTQAALQTIDPVLGTVGQGNDLTSMLTNLQDGFSTLETDPSSEAQQSAVISSAQTLATGINTLSGAYTQARQSAQNNIVAEVGQLNTALGQLGAISDQIISLQAGGQSTADLQNQRNAVMQTISGLVDAGFLPQANGDMLVVTAGGATLPTHTPDPVSAGSSDVAIGPTAVYPGSIPPITVAGTDITTQMTGGQIGANITLRDQTLPTRQAELDEFAQNLAGRFDQQGLTLFTTPGGTVPYSSGLPVQGSYVGFASQIQVNPAVMANPALVRDGTRAVSGSPTGASAFTPNPTGEAGFDTLIQRVLNYSFGTNAQAGVPQSATHTSGLGPTGTLSAPYAAPTTLSDIASSLTSAQSQESALATSNLSNAQAVQTGLQAKLTAQSGVDTDTEMSNLIQLQNSYGANAKIISAVQSMFADVLDMIS